MITYLLIGLFLLLFVTAALAPLESLGWWADWSRKGAEKGPAGFSAAETEPTSDEPDLYIIYLSVCRLPSSPVRSARCLW